MPIERFKKFLSKLEKTDDGHVIIKEPIHFKMMIKTLLKKTPEGHVIIGQPIHFRSQKDDLKEDFSSTKRTEYLADHENIPKNLPEKIADQPTYKWEKHHTELSDRLASRHHPDDDEKKYLHHYTKEAGKPSRALNKALVNGSELTDVQKKMHSAILNNVRPAKEEFHLYSGTQHDFGEMAKHSKDGILHSPAHISATHNPNVALSYAKPPSENETGHVVHVHVQPGDNILHLSGLSKYKTEHETVLPAGTKLKYSHTTYHKDVDNTGLADKTLHVNVHHFTVHRE